MKTKRNSTQCYCDDKPSFNKNYEFEDGTGFECYTCGANVYYDSAAHFHLV